VDGFTSNIARHTPYNFNKVTPINTRRASTIKERSFVRLFCVCVCVREREGGREDWRGNVPSSLDVCVIIGHGGFVGGGVCVSALTLSREPHTTVCSDIVQREYTTYNNKRMLTFYIGIPYDKSSVHYTYRPAQVPNPVLQTRVATRMNE
jgi:hypothetical protein